MEILKAVLLGLVQGLTEFLPVSSTAHLVLAEKLLGFESSGLTFDIFAHFGTFFALLIYFRKDWLSVLTEVFEGFKPKTHNEPRARLLVLLLLGTVPAAAIGFFIEPMISDLRNPPIIVLALLFVSLIFIVAEKFAKQKQGFGSIKGADSIFIGLAQALALIPGVSRSGITISAGLMRGITREAATRFAFMLSAPIILGAGLHSLIGAELGNIDAGVFFAGFASSFVFGYIAVKFLISYLKTHTLIPFAVYRIILSALIIFLIWNGSL